MKDLEKVIASIGEIFLALAHLIFMMASIVLVWKDPAQATSCAVVAIGILLYSREWK